MSNVPTTIQALSLVALCWIGTVQTIQLVGSNRVDPATSVQLALSRLPTQQGNSREVSRLQAENAALQVIVKNASFPTVYEGNARAAPGPSFGGSNFNMPDMPPIPPLLVDTGAGRTTPPGTSDSQETAGKDAPATEARIAFKPIRLTENGSLLYLAADGNIRVSPPGGDLYGVNGQFIKGAGGEAEIEVSGNRVRLPLIGE